MKPLQPQTDERVNWELQLVYELEMMGEMTTSDAQGFIEAHQDQVDDLFDHGYTPNAAGHNLLGDDEKDPEAEYFEKVTRYQERHADADRDYEDEPDEYDYDEEQEFDEDQDDEDY